MIRNLEHFEDSRGIIIWTSPKLMEFNYKYILTGTIKPKTVRGNHYHKDTIEKLLCVSGTLLAILGKQTFTLGKGDIIDIPLNTIHYFVNIGNEDATFIEFKNREYDENDKDTYN